MGNVYDLRGKTALITGAAGLLGKEHANALLENGARVILTDINKKALNEIKKELNSNYEKANVIVLKMDVSKENEINSTVIYLKNKGIRVDILINNAAIDPKVKHDQSLDEDSRLENFPLREWNKQISVGLTGAFFCAKIFGSLMARDKKGGVILNIASDLSVISPDQRLYKKTGLNTNLQPVKPVTYSVIKTGIIGLTRYLATYWSESGVRANALSPGGIYNGQNDDFVKEISKRIPLGRMAHVSEYRAAVQFLCSDASSYMNGQNIIIDGGRSIW